MSDIPDHRMLLVHAHPDDETIGQGATMAKYAAEGRGVTLVTCTAGEMGEILVPELEHLADHLDGGLAEHRRTELADAMDALGVTDSLDDGFSLVEWAPSDARWPVPVGAVRITVLSARRRRIEVEIPR